MLFSERFGYKPRNIIQVDSMDQALRNGLWNVVSCEVFNSGLGGADIWEDDMIDHFYKVADKLWNEFFKVQLDLVPFDLKPGYAEIRRRFYALNWYEVYDFLEFVGPLAIEQETFYNECNRVLERERSGYRFVGGRLVPIVGTEEIGQVELAANNPLASVRKHIATGIDLLAKRPNPDYRNSIKEAITAVEAICRSATGDEHATLGKALDLIEKQGKVALHPALKEGFKKLYGYTNDADGIRHAMLEEPDLGIEDAVFWLVTCSAFVNYLTEKARRSGISLTVGEEETTGGTE